MSTLTKKERELFGVSIGFVGDDVAWVHTNVHNCWPINKI